MHGGLVLYQHDIHFQKIFIAANYREILHRNLARFLLLSPLMSMKVDPTTEKAIKLANCTEYYVFLGDGGICVGKTWLDT